MTDATHSTVKQPATPATNAPAKRPSLVFRLLVRLAPPVAEAILVSAGGVVILLAPAIAAGVAAHAAAWCLRLGHFPLARALGAAAGLLVGLVTIARLVHEQVLGLGEERPADHKPAIARLNAAHAPPAEAFTASQIVSYINSRKPPGTH